MSAFRAAVKAAAAAFAFIVSVLSFSAHGHAQTVRGAELWRGPASAAAARFDLPVEWVLAVIEAESGGRTEMGGRPTISHAGAMGLMQIMPGTWADLRAAYRLGPDPHDPGDNIVAGTAYLRDMYDRFGFPGLFAAYNAGPARYREHRSTGRPLPRETRDYVARVTARIGGTGFDITPGQPTDRMLGAGQRRPASDLRKAPAPLFFERRTAETMPGSEGPESADDARGKPAASAGSRDSSPTSSRTGDDRQSGRDGRAERYPAGQGNPLFPIRRPDPHPVVRQGE